MLNHLSICKSNITYVCKVYKVFGQAIHGTKIIETSFPEAIQLHRQMIYQNQEFWWAK